MDTQRRVIRIGVIGSKGVGKSSLIERYLHGTFGEKRTTKGFMEIKTNNGYYFFHFSENETKDRDFLIELSTFGRFGRCEEVVPSTVRLISNVDKPWNPSLGGDYGLNDVILFSAKSCYNIDEPIEVILRCLGLERKWKE